MKIRKQDELESEYRDIGGVKGLLSERDGLIFKYPFSVLVTADYTEIENAEKWCKDNVSQWTKLWYGKTDYDYGYMEFLFNKEEDKSKFKNIVEELVIEYQSGLRGKTVDGPDILESK